MESALCVSAARWSWSIQLGLEVDSTEVRKLGRFLNRCFLQMATSQLAILRGGGVEEEGADPMLLHVLILGCAEAEGPPKRLNSDRQCMFSIKIH